jgi:hypothetical protein
VLLLLEEVIADESLINVVIAVPCNGQREHTGAPKKIFN